MDNKKSIKITDESEKSPRLHIKLCNTSGRGSPNISKNNSQESSNKRLQMDLSHVSFLKTHIVNDEVYNLAHQGHTRENDHRSDTLKSI